MILLLMKRKQTFLGAVKMKKQQEKKKSLGFSARRMWDINPVERVKQSKKNYDRKNKNWKKEI